MSSHHVPESTALIKRPNQQQPYVLPPNTVLIHHYIDSSLQQPQRFSVPAPELPQEVKEEIEKARSDAKADNTKRKIEQERKLVEEWRDKHYPGLEFQYWQHKHLTHYFTTLKTFIANDRNKTKKPTARNTLQTKMVICKAHFFTHLFFQQQPGSEAAEDLKELQETEKGLKNKARERIPKLPLELEDLSKIIKGLNRSSNLGKQDTLLHMFSWFSAMRASEVVALNWENMSQNDKTGAIVIDIVKSKTDQIGNGQTIIIDDAFPIAGVTLIGALNDWKNVLTQKFGKLKNTDPVFRRINQRDEIEPNRMKYDFWNRRFKINLRDIAKIAEKDYATHSNRRGYITNSVRKNGADGLLKAGRRARHKNSTTTNAYYSDPVVDDARPVIDNDDEKEI